MKIGLLIDPLRTLAVHKDTSCRLAAEAERRNAEIFYFTLEDIFLEGEQVKASGCYVSFDAGKGLSNSVRYLNRDVINLKELDVLLIRKDPPVTSTHISILYLLELLENDVLMINAPRAIRNGHSKLQTLKFPQFLPEQLIASNIDQISKFIEKHKDIIVKPLNGMGGSGVVRLKPGDKTTKSLLQTMERAYGYPLIAQKFIKESVEGEKRIFLFDGDICGAIVKKPAKDDFRGNITAGATIKKAILSETDKEICETLKPYLKERGLFFVGLDLIGPYLIEINSISPGAISLANTVLKQPLEEIFWDKIERKLKA